MGFEGPLKVESLEELKNKALFIAQTMSQKWKQIPNPATWDHDYPDFSYIYSLTVKGSKSGIQRWFEGKTEDIGKQTDENAKDIMWRRLLIDVEKHSKELDDIIAGR